MMEILNLAVPYFGLIFIGFVAALALLNIRSAQKELVPAAAVKPAAALPAAIPATK